MHDSGCPYQVANYLRLTVLMIIAAGIALVSYVLGLREQLNVVLASVVMLVGVVGTAMALLRLRKVRL
jgi:membrane protein YdbS with pleckstrin-like domain